MSKIKWMRSPSLLVFLYKDKVINIPRDSKQFKEVNRLIKNDDEEGLKDFLYPEFRVKKYTGGTFEIKEKKVVKAETGEPLLPCLQNKLMEFSKESFPYKAFDNFCKNIMQNPDPRSREQLYSFLEKYAFPITLDGCFLAYKYVTEVTEDGWKYPKGTLVDSYSRSFNNNPGMIVAMDRSKCDSNPNNECSTGLHVAAYEYARSCGSGNTIIEVLVNPKDVVSIPRDHNCQKMRVCRYVVLKRNSEEVKKSYLSSKFIAGRVAQAVEEKGMVGDQELKKMSAREIVSYVEEKTGKHITNCLKSKEAILQKAIKLLNLEHKNENVQISLKGLSAAQVVTLVKDQTGYEITFSLKSKKAILRRAHKVLNEHGLKVKG